MATKKKKAAQTPDNKGSKNKKSTGAKSSKKEPKEPLEDLIPDGKCVLTVDTILSNEEVVLKSREMISEIEILNQLKDDLKASQTEYKGKISAQQKRVTDLEILILSGKKKEVTQALKVKNFKTTKVMFVKIGTDLKDIKPEDIYKEEPFSALDYQIAIAHEEGVSDDDDLGLEGDKELALGEGEGIEEAEEVID